MAMTDYSSKLVHTGYCNGDTSLPIKVYAAYKSVQSTANNRSTVYCGMYVTTPSGWDIGSWGDFNGSYVGSKSNTFDGTIPNFEGTRWLAENLSFTVDHDDEGKATATIYWKWGVNSPWGRVQNPSGSFTIALPTIARASSVSADNGTLGTEQTLTVTRKSSSFTHTITYACGDASGTICTKSSSTSIDWTPPLSLAKQNTTGGSVSITLAITTYNGSDKVGSAKTTTFKATIPSSVKPTASLALSDPTGHLSTYGGYVQGQSKLAATLTGAGSQGSTIRSYQLEIGQLVYTSSSATADLPTAGSLTVKGTVTDSRGRTGSASKSVNVLAYANPKITKMTASRCASDGAAQNDGAYAKVIFSASIISLSSKNTAAYNVQYREEGANNWTSVQASSAAGNYSPANVAVVFPAATEKAFEVRVGATDAFGTTYSGIRVIPVAFALLQADTTGTGLAIGQLAVDPNTFAVGLPMKVAMELYHGGYNYFETEWTDLGLSSAVSESDNKFGHYLGCAYRVIGRHVFVVFNCSFTFAGDAIIVNLNSIPAKYRPARNIYAMCATGGRAVARCLVNSSGEVMVDWVQILSSASITTSATVNWLTGYIDYWI